jgi:preprotein translocase subunit SecA
MLIGMDIIARGDFAVTNYDGKTVFSFRMPSVEQIDFVEQLRKGQPARVPPKVGRNAPCPCGSGKKYKNCCLKK